MIKIIKKKWKGFFNSSFMIVIILLAGIQDPQHGIRYGIWYSEVLYIGYKQTRSIRQWFSAI